MSEEKKSGSPSGAGKSLALMQQRLLSKPQSEGGNDEAAAPGIAPTAASGPGQPAAHQLAAPSTTTVPNTPAAAPNRPKGKDFATMAMNAKTTSAPSAAAPAPQAQPLAPNRPKGKDFAAMANRMPAPTQPLPTAAAVPESVHPQDPARAAKMQAAARAAAGLPPLQTPTATTFTTIPPPISASVPAHRHSAVPAPLAAQTQYKHPGQSGPTPMRPQQIPRPKEVRRSTSRSSTAQARRNFGSQAQMTAAAAASPTTTAAPAPPGPSKPTPQPSIAESRLSLSAGSLAPAGGAHVSPLIGQRLRDLVASLDANYVLDAEAEEQVLQLADDFLDKVTRQSLRLAQHRGSKTLDVQDVQLALSKQWGIVVPGLGAPTLRSSKPENRASASSSSGTKRRATESTKTGASSRPTKKAKTSSSTAATAS